jgi:peptidoglycan/LPS O-acetylase OafA/YrhL
VALALLGIVAGTAALIVTRVWPADTRLVAIISPPNYHGVLTAVLAVSVFVLVRRLTRPGTAAAAPVAAARARALGELTFGVFLTHLLVLNAFQRAMGWRLSEGPSTWPGMLLVPLVLGASFVLAFVLSRIPVVRRTV